MALLFGGLHQASRTTRRTCRRTKSRRPSTRCLARAPPPVVAREPKPSIEIKLPCRRRASGDLRLSGPNRSCSDPATSRFRSRAYERSDQRAWVRRQVRIFSEVIEHKLHEGSHACRQVPAVRVVYEQMCGLRNPARQQGHQGTGTKQRQNQRKRRERQPVPVRGRGHKRGHVVRQKIAADQR
jgi:hypothetical protein